MKNNIITKIRDLNKVICLLIGIIILLLDLVILIKDSMLEKKSVQIEAKISSLEYENTSSTNAKIAYEVNDKIYEVDYKANNDVAVGDKVTVKYNKDKPGELVKNEHSIFLIITIPFILLFFKIGTTHTFKYMNNRIKCNKLKKNGITINAPILDVYIKNPDSKVNKACPYVVRVKYINPQDQTPYVFESEETYVNLKELIETKNITSLPVYIDKKNTNYYYVDINSIIK